MQIKKTLVIFKAFKDLKARKDTIPPDQYVKELIILKSELDEHLQNPEMEVNECRQIQSLLLKKPNS